MSDNAREILPPSFLKRVIDENKTLTEKEVLNKDFEKELLSLSKSKAWEYVKDFINSKKKDMALSLQSLSGGDTSLEEVGFRYLILDQINVFSNQLINFVEKYAQYERHELEKSPK